MRKLVSAYIAETGRDYRSYASAQEFLDQLDATAPGCLLLDIRMPGMSGPELQSKLIERGCHIPIVFLTASADVPTAVQVLQRGAMDLIEKPVLPLAVVAAVEQAIARDAQQRAEAAELTELRQHMLELTPREREVADLLARGNSSRQIALALGLSERTVEIHRSRVMNKMQTDSVVTFGINWTKLQAALKATDNANSSYR